MAYSNFFSFFTVLLFFVMEFCLPSAAYGDDCNANDSKDCYNGDVYWYDSCGNRGSLYDTCVDDETCADGSCEANCTAKSSKKCYNGDVYWYDSCGVKGTLYQDCGINALTSVYQCSGNWLQQGTTAKDCVSGACTQTMTWGNVQDCSLSGKMCKNSACVISNTAAPIISGIQPSGSYVAPVTTNTNINTNTAADTAAPIISGIQPSGEIVIATTTIACVTNEAAACKYDIADTDYDSMENLLSGTGTSHTRSAVLSSAGNYIYYVRCKDAAGNKNIVSAKLTFSYAPIKIEGPAVSNLSPSGQIYQNTVALAAVTDKSSECRYATVDTDFDLMENKFSTGDGLDQQAIVTLPEFGDYSYYVRCKDAAGNKDSLSQVISFQYREAEAIPADAGKSATTPSSEPLVCTEYTSIDPNGVCDPAENCVCDPDCGTNNQAVDSDCAKIQTQTSDVEETAGVNWILVAIAGFAVLVLVFVIIVAAVSQKKKKTNSGEEL